MRLKLTLLLLSTMALSSVFAQSNFEKGVEFYNKRAENTVNNLAPQANINMSLSYFKKAFNTPDEEKAVVYYLQSTYFKSAYCFPEGAKERKIILAEGKKIGEQMAQKYSNSAPIQYWHAVILGSWAKESGVVSAAKEGVIDKLKDQCDKVIKLDPNYDDGAGYRFLAILHLDAPYIPFFLTWPNDDTAVELFEKSLKMNPNHISGQYYYAKALSETGNKSKAIEVLNKVTKQMPNKNRIMEENSELELCNALLRDLTK